MARKRKGPAVLPVINRKGGVGKSATAVGLASACAEAEITTCLLDLDEQSTATLWSALPRGGTDGALSPMSRLMNDDLNVGLADVAIATPFGYHVVGAGEDLRDRATTLGNEGLRDLLADRIDQAEGQWDVIILDCPPSLNMLTVNALRAATGLVIPTLLESPSLPGLGDLFHAMEKVARVNKTLQVAALFPTRADFRLDEHKAINSILAEKYSKFYYSQGIRESTKIGQSFGRQMPVTHWARSSRGAKDCRALRDELIQRGVIG